MTDRPKKIVAVTGARSEYDILFPVLDRLRNDPSFELEVLITGSHLSASFGFTAQYIESDGFKIADRIHNLINSNEKIGRVISLGNQIQGLAQTFERIKPDLVLMVGDREESLSVALTGAYMDIAVAHIAGGDIAKDGNIDNSVRYAAGKLAHLHFTILEEHKQTLIKLGEDPWRIHTVGNPALDRIHKLPHLSIDQVSQNIGTSLEDKNYLVLIQHPIITDYENEGRNIRETLDAIVSSGMKCMINYPNSDAGNHAIIEAYREYSSMHSNLVLFQNLDRLNYINLLRHASCLIGNSSSGLIEAPSMKLPVVNIGARQRGRIHAGNVIFVDNEKEQILTAIKKSTSDAAYLNSLKTLVNPYGDGNSADRIAKIIAELQINSELLHKNITY